MDTQHELTRVENEIAQVKDALRSPKVGLIASRRLFNRLWQLYRELDSLEMEKPDNEYSH